MMGRSNRELSLVLALIRIQPDLENVIKAFEDVKTTYNLLPDAVKTSARDIDITE